MMAALEHEATGGDAVPRLVIASPRMLCTADWLPEVDDSFLLAL